MGRCCYCGSLTLKNSGRTFHKFPAKNPKLLKKWLEKLPLKNWKPKETTIICSDHFAVHCLDKTGFRTRLHVDSVPTIFDDPRELCVYCRRKREPQDKNIFKFPHESPELLRKWVENMNIPGWWPKAESVLCSRHFEPSTMISKNGKLGKLKAESVPTLFSHENANASNFEAIHGISMDQSEEIDGNLMDQSPKINGNSMDQSVKINGNLMDQSAKIDENSMDQSAKMILKRGKSAKLKAKSVSTLFSTKTANALNFKAIHGISMDQSTEINGNSMDQSAGMILKRGKFVKLKTESVPTLFFIENASASNFEALHENLMDQSVEIDENSMDQSMKINGNLMDQSAEISQNSMDQLVEINGNLMDQSAKINGKLMDQSVKINGNLMDQSAKINGNLMDQSVKIAENFIDQSSKINGKLMDQSAKINGNLMDQSSKINGKLMNQSAKINGNLMNQSAKINGNFMDQSSEIPQNSMDQFVEIKGNLMDQSVKIVEDLMDQAMKIDENSMDQSLEIHENSMNQSPEISENSMNQSAEISENSMDQSAEISENSQNLKELNYDEKVDNFDIDRIFLDFPNNKLPFFDETEVPNGNYGISNYCDAEDIFNGLNKRGSGDLIDNKIAEYERSIEEKERTIEFQEKKIKQLQNQISSFKEVIFELCRDRSVSQTISRNLGFIDGEN